MYYNILSVCNCRKDAIISLLDTLHLMNYNATNEKNNQILIESKVSKDQGNLGIVYEILRI